MLLVLELVFTPWTNLFQNIPTILGCKHYEVRVMYKSIWRMQVNLSRNFFCCAVNLSTRLLRPHELNYYILIHLASHSWGAREANDNLLFVSLPIVMDGLPSSGDCFSKHCIKGDITNQLTLVASKKTIYLRGCKLSRVCWPYKSSCTLTSSWGLEFWLGRYLEENKYHLTPWSFWCRHVHLRLVHVILTTSG